MFEIFFCQPKLGIRSKTVKATRTEKEAIRLVEDLRNEKLLVYYERIEGKRGSKLQTV